MALVAVERQNIMAPDFDFTIGQVNSHNRNYYKQPNTQSLILNNLLPNLLFGQTNHHGSSFNQMCSLNVAYLKLALAAPFQRLHVLNY